MFEKIKIEKPEKIDFSNIEKYRIRPTDQIPKPETVLPICSILLIISSTL